MNEKTKTNPVLILLYTFAGIILGYLLQAIAIYTLPFGYFGVLRQLVGWFPLIGGLLGYRLGKKEPIFYKEFLRQYITLLIPIILLLLFGLEKNVGCHEIPGCFGPKGDFFTVYNIELRLVDFHIVLSSLVGLLVFSKELRKNNKVSIGIYFKTYSIMAMIFIILFIIFRPFVVY